MARASEDVMISGSVQQQPSQPAQQEATDGQANTGGNPCDFLLKTPNLKFTTHYHPHVCDFIKDLNRHGIPALLTLPNQQFIGGDRFYTTSATERDTAIAKSGYQIEQIACYVFDSKVPGTIPLHKAEWSGAEWSGEKVKVMCYVFDSQVPGTTPLYRLISNFYTTSASERDAAIAAGYKSGGIAGYVFQSQMPGTTPLYQLVQTVFREQYLPTDIVERPYPTEDVDFSDGGAYSLYNWELFFHIPLLLATRLSKNQKFEDAQQWFHYIFNPTSSSPDLPPQRYWKVLPFYQNTESGRIGDLLRLLDHNDNDPTIQAEKKQVQDQVTAWRNNPFNPHLIARMRLIAYQKTVVMKYIDNLIAWGDQLFSQDTMESVNIATQLYILAYDMLGPRPERVPSRGTIQEYTYQDLVTLGLDDFSNVLVNLENEFPFSSTSVSKNGGNSGASGDLGVGRAFYFCIPQNDKLLGYWDTVADRLFKIRHCMNIEGVVRQLPLFAPPIDPALLVQAVAAGVDISSVLNDINAATPHYRFTYMLQKALELCAEVRSLGAALLSALEKKDAEVLALLRSGQEIDLLAAVRLVKEQQVNEAQDTWDGLNKSKAVIQARYDYYQTLISGDLSDWEKAHLAGMAVSGILQTVQANLEVLAGVLHLIPNFDVGASGISSPVVTATFGGTNVGGALQGFAGALGVSASAVNTLASMSATMGSNERRMQEWQHQANLAGGSDGKGGELAQIDKQICAADIRRQITQLELTNHDKQTDNAKAVDEFMRSKYTNQDLYDWMVGQTSAVFFQCYQMAYDVAKRVERTFRYERGLTASNYIQFGYWDSLRKGLLAGERLYLDLKRMEMAYLDQNKREYEIAKHISLVLNNPMALIALKETGQCIVDLPEALFDADYPGHYMRRIKSVTLTIPCVTGPYTSINCTLTLLKSSIRLKSDTAEGNYVRDKQQDDLRFVDNFGAIESIATSHAQNDSGMFELNFRDERYLPFEGAGGISTWRIEMPKDTNAFDFETISDVVINLNYTARDGGERLRDAARAEVVGPPPDGVLLRMFSLKHEFPNDWYRFLHPPDTADRQTMTINLTMERFPFQFRGMSIQLQQVELFLKFKDIHDKSKYKHDGTPVGDYAANVGTALVVTLIAPGDSLESAASKPLDPTDPKGFGLPRALFEFADQPMVGSWRFDAKDTDPNDPTHDDVLKIAESLRYQVTANGIAHNRLRPEVIDDIVMLCHYSAS